jgi:hypothetical protein
MDTSTPGLSSYVKSKTMAERAVWDFQANVASLMQVTGSKYLEICLGNPYFNQLIYIYRPLLRALCSELHWITIQ